MTDGQGNLAAVITAAVTRHTGDRSALLRLSANCWPGRDDRTVPAARRWIEAWGPRPMIVALQDISHN